MAPIRDSQTSDLITTIPPSDLSDLMRSLAATVPTVFPPGSGSVYFQSFELPPVNLIDCLQHAAIFPKTYWHDREHRIEVCGAGQAMNVQQLSTASGYKQFTDLVCNYPAATGAALFIAGRFDNSGRYAGKDWSDFPELWWQLPSITLCRRDEKYSGVIALRPGQESAPILAQLELMLGDKDNGKKSALERPILLSRRDRPDRAEWNDGCRNILREIEMAALQKVVLARRTALEFSQPIDPYEFLKALASKGQVYRYLFAPAANTAFVGASPERLFRATNDRVESEAVAGTVPRGQSTATDEQLARLLQESRKDNREHQFVVDGIVAGLQPLSESVAAMSAPQIVKLQRVQHLISPIVARLRPGTSPIEVLEALHPTPAVCGTPRDQAMLSLRQLEPFDRGYYSGPLGVVFPDHVDVCVALRSALISGSSVNLYAGAGIVAGSDPDIEWLELEQKLQGSLEVLLGGAP